jgi:hypothetical protein
MDGKRKWWWLVFFVFLKPFFGVGRFVTMEKKKRQHFVPCFLMREIAEEESNIGAYVKNAAKYIDKAAIKKQCQSNYFYGQGAALEDILDKEWESTIAEIVKRISNDCYSINACEIEKLKKYFVIQHVRTEKSSSFLEKEFSNALNALKKKYPKDYQSVMRTKSEKKIITHTTEKVIKDWLSSVKNLELYILKNNTAISFITSDNPTYLFNDFLWNKKSHNQVSTFFTSEGVQAYFPISSKW